MHSQIPSPMFDEFVAWYRRLDTLAKIGLWALAIVAALSLLVLVTPDSILGGALLGLALQLLAPTFHRV